MQAAYHEVDSGGVAINEGVEHLYSPSHAGGGE